MLVPKLFTTLQTYTRAQLGADVVAGVIVGVVALPLAIAFAIASGVTPDRGLYTAVIAGFLISALGGSRVQIGGPTGAFVVIVYGIVQQHGLDGLLAATMMAGVILVVLGLARLGGAIKFIPFPVITGFTAAIGALIAVQQLRDALGLRISDPPAELVERIGSLPPARRHLQSLRRRHHPVHPGDSRALAPGQPPGARAAGGAPRGHRRRAAPRPSRGDDRQSLRRDPRDAPLADAAVALLRRPARAGGARVRHRRARRHRVAALCRGGGRHDRRPAPVQHGAGGTGDRQHRVAAVRRDAGDRRHRPDGDQHQERRPHAGRGHRARADAAAHHAVLRTLGRADSSGGAGRDRPGRLLPPERMAGLPPRAAGAAGATPW